MGKAVAENEPTWVVMEPVSMIQTLMVEEGTNSNQLSGRIGLSRQAVNQMLNRGKGRMQVQSFQRLLGGLGYELVVRKVSGARG